MFVTKHATESFAAICPTKEVDVLLLLASLGLVTIHDGHRVCTLGSARCQRFGDVFILTKRHVTCSYLVMSQDLESEESVSILRVKSVDSSSSSKVNPVKPGTCT